MDGSAECQDFKRCDPAVPTSAGDPLPILLCLLVIKGGMMAPAWQAELRSPLPLIEIEVGREPRPHAPQTAQTPAHRQSLAGEEVPYPEQCNYGEIIPCKEETAFYILHGSL